MTFTAARAFHVSPWKNGFLVSDTITRPEENTDSESREFYDEPCYEGRERRTVSPEDQYSSVLHAQRRRQCRCTLRSFFSMLKTRSPLRSLYAINRMVEEVKESALALLDADEEGRLTLEDATTMALNMASNVSEATRDEVSRWAQGDGSGLWSVYKTLAPYRKSLLATTGFLCTFYGQNFKYTVLFGRTFALAGWPIVQPAIRELEASYRRSKKAARDHAEEIEKAKKKLGQCLELDVKRSRGTLVLSALNNLRGAWEDVEPRKLFAVLRTAYVGVSASFAAVLSENAAKLGVGFGFGSAIGRAVNSVFGPLLASALSKLRDATLDEEDNEDLLDLANMIISFVSTAIGVYVVHKVDDVIYLYSACLVGATLAVDSIVSIFDQEEDDSSSNRNKRANKKKKVKRTTKKARIPPAVRQALVVSIAAAGFTHQKILGRGRLPFVLKIPLSPFIIAESILDQMAVQIRRVGGM